MHLQLCTLWQICWPMMSQSVLASMIQTSCCAWQHATAGVSQHAVLKHNARMVRTQVNDINGTLTPSCCTIGTKRSCMKPCACNTCSSRSSVHAAARDWIGVPPYHKWCPKITFSYHAISSGLTPKCSGCMLADAKCCAGGTMCRKWNMSPASQKGGFALLLH